MAVGRCVWMVAASADGVGRACHSRLHLAPLQAARGCQPTPATHVPVCILPAICPIPLRTTPHHTTPDRPHLPCPFPPWPGLPAPDEPRAKQTSVIWGNLDPVWDEQLMFRDVCAASELGVELWDLGGSRSATQLNKLSQNPSGRGMAAQGNAGRAG